MITRGWRIRTGTRAAFVTTLRCLKCSRFLLSSFGVLLSQLAQSFLQSPHWAEGAPGTGTGCHPQRNRNHRSDYAHADKHTADRQQITSRRNHPRDKHAHKQPKHPPPKPFFRDHSGPRAIAADMGHGDVEKCASGTQIATPIARFKVRVCDEIRHHNGHEIAQVWIEQSADRNNRKKPDHDPLRSLSFRFFSGFLSSSCRHKTRRKLWNKGTRECRVSAILSKRVRSKSQ